MAANDSESSEGLVVVRKKRRSWKHHRIDAADVCGLVLGGSRHRMDLYACDQCDKMFGKQSSLARHKYEHSGTFSTFTASQLLFYMAARHSCVVPSATYKVVWTQLNDKPRSLS